MTFTNYLTEFVISFHFFSSTLFSKKHFDPFLCFHEGKKIKPQDEHLPLLFLKYENSKNFHNVRFVL